MVQKGKYNGEEIVVKTLLPDTRDPIILVFMKEGLILSQIKCENVVSLIKVCDIPPAIMLEYCVFSFKPFEVDRHVSSLESFLHIVNEQDVYQQLTSIGNYMASDILNAVCYLHAQGIVHRDLKPANILVSNIHYKDLDGEELQSAYDKKPIVCKVADLGEARSLYTRTNALFKNDKTKFIDRGSQPFMAPELVVSELLLTSAGIDDLKRADVWSVLMTIFMILNPDQEFPFERDIDVTNKTTPELLLNSIKSQLSKLQAPSESKKYLLLQATQYERLRSVFYENLQFNPKERMSIEVIREQLNSHGDLEFNPLPISQSSALEKYDHEVANMLQNSTVSDYGLPNNDATNSCAFLSLGIIDKLISKKLSIPFLKETVSSVIINFPQKFNDFRTRDLVDIYEAYLILMKNKLLDHLMDFSELITENEKLYTIELFAKLKKELSLYQQLARKENNCQFMS